MTIAFEVLVDKLAGMSCHDIANYLKEEGIKGHHGSHNCALAFWFKSQGIVVSVEAKRWARQDESGEYETEPWPESVCEFIGRFDEHEWPELEA